ncbi:ribonucleoprotein PTB-binding 2 isoform X2 [Dermochelys coriacea]|uniref:ribonucleoprotein PTB-binding 2 isoform X2 n=1 Tax=Dermochelys coriacea TaxID=27794 RepID=UPI0018E8270F|nr:ribonucleoprotein PTB-binding 2 isoform X2 [Dermochelys coriacea]
MPGSGCKMAAAAEPGTELSGAPRQPGLGAPPERGGKAAPLSPPAIARRLEGARRELSNRRKVLLRNLPEESSSQEIHELFKDYELKYCYVDRNKRTAFVTLQNGEQAQNAIQMFHQYSLRGKEISVQLQPTDALLCVTNLPTSFSLQGFEELVCVYGNVERCFLVYNEVTGHSKGYGFVEYMKKDSAAKARMELLGKQLGENTLFAQWMDINQLTTDLVHSKCLCVDKLPNDDTDSEELMQMFSFKYKPVFCQFAEDEGSYIGGFAVIEYETAEQAEEVQEVTDGMTIGGKRVQVSYCAPGAPGRSTLAAFIAAQRMMRNNRKGLLPEPNPVQIMKSLNNPAMLQMLLQPQLYRRARKRVLGVSAGLPHLINTTVNPGFLHLNKVHQNSVLGNASNLLLQNFSHLQLAQKQLIKIETVQTNSKPGLLGEPPPMLLQTVLGTGPIPSVSADLGNHGEAHTLCCTTGVPSEVFSVHTMASQQLASRSRRLTKHLPYSWMMKKLSGDYPLGSDGQVLHNQFHRIVASNATPNQTTAAAGMGILPFFPNQPVVGQAMPGQNNTQDKQSTTVGLSEGAGSGSQTYLQSLTNFTTGGLRTEHPQQQSQPKSTDTSSGIPSKKQTSLLGEPPKEIRLSTNPYLNLASVLRGVCLSAVASKATSTQQQTGLSSNIVDAAVSQGTTSQHAMENYFNYSQQYGDYTQEAVQQWYQHYAQAYNTTQARGGEFENEASEEPARSYGDYNTYLQVMPSYYTGAQGSYQPGSFQPTPQNPLNKVAPVRSEKRSSSQLISSPEAGPVEYNGQHTQGAESYLKKKRVY